MEKLRKIDIKDVCFFDIEVARNQEEVDTESKEFALFKKKFRDKYETTEDAVALYNSNAGLRMIYNKVVCISVGAVRDGKVYIKSYTGEEKSILKNFFEKTAEFKYLCNFNLINYDLPICRINSYRYPDLLGIIPPQFDDSFKKPWSMDSCIDLMQGIGGCFYVNPSLDEVCHHLGIKSSKEGGIDGSMISEFYYNNGIGEIEQYCKRDVLAVINLFLYMRREPMFDSFIDVDLLRSGAMPKIPLMEKLINNKKLTATETKKLKEVLKDFKDKPSFKLIQSTILSVNPNFEF
jgi:predicted PolB exonuclease-like 3'-5' exonuclease